MTVYPIISILHELGRARGVCFYCFLALIVMKQKEIIVFLQIAFFIFNR